MNVRDDRRLRGEGEQLGREDDGETLEESIAALAREGLIYDTGRKRNGQTVWAVVPQPSASPLQREI
jgi:hypothetical protein